MKCPLCGAVVGFFEVRHSDTPADRYEQTLLRLDADLRDIKHSLDDERNDLVLRRLETALRNVQSSLTSLRSRIVNIEGRLGRRR